MISVSAELDDVVYVATLDNDTSAPAYTVELYEAGALREVCYWARDPWGLVHAGTLPAAASAELGRLLNVELYAAAFAPILRKL